MNERASTFDHTPVGGPDPIVADSVTPRAAWDLVRTGQATLLDVRTIEERSYVGRVGAALHVAWATGTSMNRNPHFLRQVEQKLPDRTATVLLLCRSGKRSAAAAEVLRKAGYQRVFNILEGFEGNLDGNGHRGTSDGWRFHGLPWEQD